MLRLKSEVSVGGRAHAQGGVEASRGRHAVHRRQNWCKQWTTMMSHSVHFFYLSHCEDGPALPM